MHGCQKFNYFGKMRVMVQDVFKMEIYNDGPFYTSYYVYEAWVDSAEMPLWIASVWDSVRGLYLVLPAAA